MRGESGGSQRRFRHVAVGGTFDLLHLGHDALLEKAIELGDRVTIGLTTDEMVSRMYKDHEVDGYEARLKAIERFLAERNASDRVEVIPLEDAFGPTIEDDDFDAIIVSRETEPGALRINEIRRSRGMRELAVVVIEMVLGEDGLPISSTRIRQRIIDRYGRLRCKGTNPF
jgi:pantetheine-phosphate adenylyltransferase